MPSLLPSLPSRCAFLAWPGRHTWIYWLCQFGGWLALALLFLAMDQASDTGDPLRESVGNHLMLCLILLLLSHGLRHLIRHYVLPATRVFRAMATGVLLVLGVSVAGALATTGLLLLWAPLAVRETGILDPILGLSFLYGWFLLLWAAAYMIVKQADYLINIRVERLKLEKDAKDAELRALKSQLNPHFLFNALNTIKALIDENPDQAREAVVHLSRLLRETLRGSGAFTMPLRDEWGLVNSYLHLESLRFEERLRVENRLAADTLDCHLPSMLLLTLAENAIKHGISRTAQGGAVCIESGITGRNGSRRLWLRVTNPGCLQRAPFSGPAQGHGLTNVRDQLAQLYRDTARLDVTDDGHGTVTASVFLPSIHSHDQGTAG